MRKPYNFLKHSDRDKNTAIDIYQTAASFWRIFIAISIAGVKRARRRKMLQVVMMSPWGPLEFWIPQLTTRPPGSMVRTTDTTPRVPSPAAG